jgi:hypothetical protein
MASLNGRTIFLALSFRDFAPAAQGQNEASKREKGLPVPWEAFSCGRASEVPAAQGVKPAELADRAGVKRRDPGFESLEPLFEQLDPARLPRRRASLFRDKEAE